VEEKVMPAIARLDAVRRERLGLDRLRPWDLDVDVEDFPPIRPFTTENELMDLDRRLFAAVDERFAAEFTALRRRKMLDLMSRKGKAPGGYQYSIEDVRLPFIFANAVGRHDDVQTLLHEGGHAFHSLLSRDEPLLAYRQAPLEFAEVASMGMELMGLEHLEEIYPREMARVARRGHLETVLRLFPWIASIDSFQHWLYTHEGHSRAERKDAWLAIRHRFSKSVDHTGLQDQIGHAWQAQGHLFGSPFYYIEYGIAQIGALQVWRNARKDQRAAVERYRTALALGGSRPLPELFAAAGLEFDMGSRLLGRLVDDVMDVLGEESPAPRRTAPRRAAPRARAGARRRPAS
jgi:oligoendopeptidase F